MISTCLKGEISLRQRKFLKKALKAEYNQMPRVITTDQYKASEMAILEETYFGRFKLENAASNV